ncbi:uncharacterized protein LOC134494307 isoform X2 [Candoia aspera]|uniref:uncharacterized protein LOC134494307 isoform X2 n=1 Tax=Candoia aspera TaxID=51853 RepID=UPI002FD7B1ED
MSHVLVPEASSDYMTGIRNDYENILINIIIHLEKLISQNNTSNCNLKTNTGYLHSLKNKSIDSLASCLRKMTNCSIISSELKYTMGNVSHLTLDILKKNRFTIKPQKRRCCPCRNTNKISDRTFCCLKTVVSTLSSGWKKFLYHDYPQGE